jgi:hypothetical protein
MANREDLEILGQFAAFASTELNSIDSGITEGRKLKSNNINLKELYRDAVSGQGKMDIAQQLVNEKNIHQIAKGEIPLPPPLPVNNLPNPYSPLPAPAPLPNSLQMELPFTISKTVESNQAPLEQKISKFIDTFSNDVIIIKKLLMEIRDNTSKRKKV